MTSVRLVALSDDYDHSLGLAIKGIARADDMMAERSDGVLLAHDILEHMNGPHNIGKVWDELEALGAIWHVRGRHGDLLTGRSFHSPQVNVASDLTRMFPDWLQEDAPRCPPRRWHTYDDDFRDIIAISRRDIPREHEDEDRAMIDRYLDEALNRMRIGFSKARRRYGNSYTDTNMFSNIKEAVAEAVRWIDFEGQEFVLTYTATDARVRPIMGGYYE